MQAIPITIPVAILNLIRAMVLHLVLNPVLHHGLTADGRASHGPLAASARSAPARQYRERNGERGQECNRHDRRTIPCLHCPYLLPLLVTPERGKSNSRTASVVKRNTPDFQRYPETAFIRREGGNANSAP
jgi:hypothetical protein